MYVASMFCADLLLSMGLGILECGIVSSSGRFRFRWNELDNNLITQPIQRYFSFVEKSVKLFPIFILQFQQIFLVL